MAAPPNKKLPTNNSVQTVRSKGPVGSQPGGMVPAGKPKSPVPGGAPKPGTQRRPTGVAKNVSGQKLPGTRTPTQGYGK